MVNTFFPTADGTVKLSGDQGFRKSTLIRDQPERGAELRDDLRRESDGSQPIDTVMDRQCCPKRLLVDRWELHLSSSRRTWSSAPCAGPGERMRPGMCCIFFIDPTN